MSVARSVPWLESVDARLDRARDHLDTIQGEIRDFLSGTKNNFVLKTNQSAVWMVWWIDEPNYLPMALSVMTGEFLYNLRAALDNLVCALVRSKKPDSSCSGRRFPIYSDAAEYAKSRSEALRGVPDAAKIVIDQLQPFTRGPGTADVDPLNVLNVLRNRDTHRALHLAVGYQRHTRFLISDIDGYPKAYVTVPTWMFAAGPQTMPLPLEPDTVDPEMNVKAIGTSVVGFLDEGPWGDRPVNEVLTACLEYVENRVIARFTQFLQGRG
jgi:hypothetical protein